MAGKRYIETYQKGPAGQFFTVLFWLVNGFCAYGYFSFVTTVPEWTSGTPEDVTATLVMGSMVNFAVWIPLAILTYILMRVTRGKKIIQEIEAPSIPARQL